MKRLLFAAALASAAVFGCAAQAQTYQDSSGTIIPGVTNVPFPYTHLGPGQYNFTPSTATVLNSALRGQVRGCLLQGWRVAGGIYN